FFIQSTHNTISSQIAINLKCHGHNNTFVHGGISFESALFEAFLLFLDNKIKTALVGGYDEMTPSYFKILDRVEFWRKKHEAIDDPGKSTDLRICAGEGSVSVMLSSEKNEKSYASIDDMEILYQPESIKSSIEAFLDRNSKRPEDIDLIVTGMNGDEQNDAIYKTISDDLFGNKAHAWYRHLSGDYFTSAGFGLWLTASCIRQKYVPSFVSLNSFDTGNLKNVLLFNHYKNKNFSLILLSAC
ncbi:MAG TPA: hypothetical protein PLR88_05490, partial [Bacteroidales bacterium]|nr:hypothetical protein [Bacteroidales bacterium]